MGSVSTLLRCDSEARSDIEADNLEMSWKNTGDENNLVEPIDASRHQSEEG